MSFQILALGEILWDLLPTGMQLGGAPANFAFHCRALGAEARLITRVGDDELGRLVLDRFRAGGSPTETIQIDSDRPTGTVDVELSEAGVPRYTIREDVAWDRITADDAGLAAARSADAVCFGSLALRSETARRAIAKLVSHTSPRAIRIFDVNLRHPFVYPDVIAEALELCDVLKLNDEELTEIAAMFGLGDGTRETIEELSRRFGLKAVALTRGADGSLLFADGRWSDLPGRPVAVRDTIGAGDSFTAALAIGFLNNRPLDEIHRHSGAVAAFVCSQPGGTPDLPDSLKRPDMTRREFSL